MVVPIIAAEAEAQADRGTIAISGGRRIVVGCRRIIVRRRRRVAGLLVTDATGQGEDARDQYQTTVHCELPRFPPVPEITGDVDYVIGYANDRIISTRWSHYTYCHGTPHGFGGSKTENLVLEPSPHEFKPADLFGPGKGWIPELQSLFWDALSAQG
jgi:hypothetical protein